ncbi:MAG: STAS domain-containing protein [Chloroflexota bacterium]
MSDLTVHIRGNGNATVVVVSGRVDSVTAVALDEEFGKVARDNKRIVLDLNDVAYLSSAGVRAILKVSQTAQRSGGGVSLVRIPTSVAQVLENVGVTTAMRSFASVDEAVAGF